MIIEIAGIDGAGKSTQIARLARVAQECKVPCYERSLRSTGRRILSGIAAQQGLEWRALFDRGAVELATALEMFQLFHATVVPIQFSGQMIVTDTYVREWLAVAIAEGGENVSQIVEIYRAMPSPDLSVQLDCSVDTAFCRIVARPKGDHLLRSGGKARLQRLADAYATGLDELVGYETAHVSGEAEEAATFAAILQLILAWAAEGDSTLYSRLSSAAIALTGQRA